MEKKKKKTSYGFDVNHFSTFISYYALLQGLCSNHTGLSETGQTTLNLPWLLPLLKNLFSHMLVCWCCFLSSFSFSAHMLPLLGSMYLKNNFSSISS